MDQGIFALGVADEEEELLVDFSHFLQEIAPLHLDQPRNIGGLADFAGGPQVANRVDHRFPEHPRRPEFRRKVQHPGDIPITLDQDVDIGFEIRQVVLHMCYGEARAAVHVREGHDRFQRALDVGEVHPCQRQRLVIDEAEQMNVCVDAVATCFRQGGRRVVVILDQAGRPNRV